MTLRTPAFWQEKNSIWKTFLTPLSCLYRATCFVNRQKTETYTSRLPVLCIGNVTVGGSGKTPVVQNLLQIITQQRLANKPCILSRGYGGTKDVHLVSRDDTCMDVGDEPLLLSRTAPVVVAGNRAEGAGLIEEHGFDMIIMDDGFQNFTLAKTLSFLVVDGTAGFGNNALLPAGPLREPLDAALSRTQAAIIINDDTYNVRTYLPPDMPIFEADIEPHFSGEKNRPYIAFCGIGQPDKFKITLSDLELDIKDFIPFPDHHAFTQQDVQSLIKSAQTTNTRLLTTEKDAGRLESFPEIRPFLEVLPITLKWRDEDAVITFLKEGLRHDR